jgi:hypothetical protein
LTGIIFYLFANSEEFAIGRFFACHSWDWNSEDSDLTSVYTNATTIVASAFVVQ